MYVRILIITTKRLTRHATGLYKPCGRKLGRSVTKKLDHNILKIRPDGKIEIKSEEFKGVYDTILYPQNKEWYPSLEYLKIKYENKYE